MSVETNTPEPQRISRRTLAAGAAWAAPAVAVAAAAPAYAKSGITTTTTTLPPCITNIVNDSVNWNVDGVRYSGCNTYCSHRDVRLSFHVDSCDTPVTIRVSNVVNNSMWCAWTNSVGTLTKTVAANTTGTLTFPSTGDVIVGGGGCKITAYESANDGMHINPCTNGPFFKYEIWYAATTAGSPAVTGFWGDANNPPKPNNVVPAVPTGLAICRASVSGTSAGFTATWSGPGADSYDLQYQVRNANNTDWGTAVAQNNLTAPTYTSGSVTNGTRRIRFRVRATSCRGDSAWSGYVELAAGTTVTCGTGKMASSDVRKSETTEEPKVDTGTTTEAVKVTTDTTTEAAKVETTTTTEAAKVETTTTTEAVGG